MQGVGSRALERAFVPSQRHTRGEGGFQTRPYDGGCCIMAMAWFRPHKWVEEASALGMVETDPTAPGPSAEPRDDIGVRAGV